LRPPQPTRTVVDRHTSQWFRQLQ